MGPKSGLNAPIFNFDQTSSNQPATPISSMIFVTVGQVGTKTHRTGNVGLIQDNSGFLYQIRPSGEIARMFLVRNQYMTERKKQSVV